MPETIGALELRRKLSKILKRTSLGARFLVVHGQLKTPVATLGPPPEKKPGVEEKR